MNHQADCAPTRGSCSMVSPPPVGPARPPTARPAWLRGRAPYPRRDRLEPVLRRDRLPFDLCVFGTGCTSKRSGAVRYGTATSTTRSRYGRRAPGTSLRLLQAITQRRRGVSAGRAPEAGRTAQAGATVRGPRTRWQAYKTLFPGADFGILSIADLDTARTCMGWCPAAPRSGSTARAGARTAYVNLRARLYAVAGPAGYSMFVASVRRWPLAAVAAL